MKHSFNNIESAINTVIESSKKHAFASNTGDYKTANKHFDLTKKAINYLRENDGIVQLKELLVHSEVSVRVMVASYLLKHFEHEAILVLEEIASKSIPIQSLDAKMVLQEWRKGNLKL